MLRKQNHKIMIGNRSGLFFLPKTSQTKKLVPYQINHFLLSNKKASQEKVVIFFKILFSIKIRFICLTLIKLDGIAMG